MNGQIKRDWCKALKSGEFEQTKEYLRDDFGYCCLGVLTRLFCRAKKVSFEKVNGENPGDNDVLNEKVMKWAGLTSNNPVVDGLELSTHNDGSYRVEGKSFKEIATLIHKSKL